ncbi:YraN family protein [Castellaniella caeni]|uniref:YraN family protein n=1 Tax=Castellaniella caeni TaxID=266123 RepID=UPI0009FCE5D4|nr:YraN family protein [Castellaniella caeni]
MPTDAYARASQAQASAHRRRRRRLARQAATRQPPVPDAPPAAGSPSQQRGYQAEHQARDYLEARGLRILAQNLRCKAGEIDLIARHGDVLVFIEVRQRCDGRFGGAAASVNRAKQRRLIRTAQHFLARLCRQHFQATRAPCRFDVISLDDGGLRWIQDAFRL